MVTSLDMQHNLFPPPPSAASSCIAAAVNSQCLSTEGDGSIWRQNRLLTPMAAGRGPCHYLPHPCSSLCRARPVDASRERQQETCSLGFLRIYHRPQQPRTGTKHQRYLSALHPPPLYLETPKTAASVPRDGAGVTATQLSKTHLGTTAVALVLLFSFFF